jgi:hypothetical protein
LAEYAKNSANRNAKWGELECSRGERRYSQISLQAGETNFTLRPFTISGETFGAFVRQLLQAWPKAAPEFRPRQSSTQET